MGLEKLVQRGPLYGFGAGAATTGAILLVASLFDVVLGVVVLALLGLSILALVLLLGAPTVGPGPAGGGDGYGEMQMASPAESGGASSDALDVAAVVPATTVEYVTFAVGLGTAAVVALAFLLD